MSCGLKILNAVRLKGLELKQLAQLAGIPYNTLRGYTQSGKLPSAPTGIALAKALNVDIEWLFDDAQAWISDPPPYLDPPPRWINEVFRGGLDWEEVGEAVLAARHAHYCKLLSRHIALEISRGRAESARTLQDYLRVVGDLFTATFEQGDSAKMAALRAERLKLQETHAVRDFMRSVWPGQELTDHDRLFGEWYLARPRHWHGPPPESHEKPSVDTKRRHGKKQ